MSYLATHSAEVSMWLECPEYGRVELSRIRPKSVVAKARHDVPRCQAELIISVDGRIRRTNVMLSGFNRGRLASLIAPVPDDIPI